MPQPTITFDDGAAYERYMGIWSRLAGAAFLDWLSPAPNERWLDVGCGNGAFSEMIAQRLAPASLDGIDPAAAQIAFAKSRHTTPGARYQVGDAMALPYANAGVDQAVMALVIFFVPEPARGVAEMARVTRPGGTVSAYAWDLPGGGFPFGVMHDALRSIGKTPLMPPNPDASTLAGLQSLWTGAGLFDVQTTVITVSRTFENFEDYWSTTLLGPSLAPALAQMSAEQIEALREFSRAALPADSAGRITYTARAHAVRGRVPA